MPDLQINQEIAPEDDIQEFLAEMCGECEENNICEDGRENAANVRRLLISELRILYGGSVKPGNIRALIAEEHLDGALVGGASLDEHSFVGIVTGCLPDTGGAEAEIGDSQ